jgi:hypothetical protein
MQTEKDVKGNEISTGKGRKEETLSEMSERIERQVKKSFEFSFKKHGSFAGW